jgi:hypothetical protein
MASRDTLPSRVHIDAFPEGVGDVTVTESINARRMQDLRVPLGPNPLVVLIRSQPGMVERLLVVHADDGSGRCRVCSTGGQTGRYRFPCAIQRAAAVVDAHDRVGDDTVIGGCS